MVMLCLLPSPPDCSRAKAVMLGLDPSIHVHDGLVGAAGTMDPRVKPEGDSQSEGAAA